MRGKPCEKVHRISETHVNREEEFVINVLISIGLTAYKIEEDNESKTPDILVESDNSKILIEVKTKFDNPNYEANKNERLINGEIVFESMDSKRKNTFSSIIKDACEQLRAKKDIADYYILWLMVSNSEVEITMKRFYSTLYGSVDVLDWGKAEKKLRPCFFFENSEFYNHKDILDGAVVSNYEKSIFCINNLSDNYPTILNTKIVDFFKDSLIDPISYEKNQAGYIIDSEIDRKNGKEVIKYLQKKYNNKKLIECNLEQHTATIHIKK